MIFFSSFGIQQKLADDLLQGFVFSPELGHLQGSRIASAFGANPVVNGISADAEFLGCFPDGQAVIFYLINYPVLDG